MARPGRKPGTPKTGGRTKGTANKATREIREVAQQYGPDAIRAAAKLAGLVKKKGEDGPDGIAQSEPARIAAIGVVLDRAYGKAPQAITGPNGGPLEIVAALGSMSEDKIEELIAHLGGDGSGE